MSKKKAIKTRGVKYTDMAVKDWTDAFAALKKAAKERAETATHPQIEARAQDRLRTLADLLQDAQTICRARMRKEGRNI